MSTLKADTIVASDGTSPVTLTKQSAAKAWSNLNGTGTIAARDSFNIASYTDNGTGDYTHTFTNAMGNANYCWLMKTDFQAGTARNANIGGDSSSQTTSAIRLHSYSITAGSAGDYEVINCGISGDLA